MREICLECEHFLKKCISHKHHSVFYKSWFLPPDILKIRCILETILDYQTSKSFEGFLGAGNKYISISRSHYTSLGCWRESRLVWLREDNDNIWSGCIHIIHDDRHLVFEILFDLIELFELKKCLHKSSDTLRNVYTGKSLTGTGFLIEDIDQIRWILDIECHTISRNMSKDSRNLWYYCTRHNRSIVFFCYSFGRSFPNVTNILDLIIRLTIDIFGEPIREIILKILRKWITIGTFYFIQGIWICIIIGKICG